jgi:L-lactate dehydrogenase complex protein LldG
VSARDAILDAVRSNKPRSAVPRPQVFAPSIGGDGSLVAGFQRELAGMGGSSCDVADTQAACAQLLALFPAAKVVCSAVPEVPGTRSIDAVRDPHELADVDVGVVRSPLGVAEAGAIWLTQDDLVVNALGVLSQHLVVLLDPAAIVPTMHEAYASIGLGAIAYGVFMSGPSATADIEGVLVHGAQGARSLTVLLCA